MAESTSKNSVGHQTAMDYKKRVCRAMNFISRNLDRDLSLDEIAAAAAFSKYHFHRIFKVVVGETVAGFTRRLRLEMAANRLMSNPFEEITSIALACGFSSSQNFAKAFRQQFETTPTAYRERMNGNKTRKIQNALSLQAHYDPETAFSQQFSNERRDIMQAEVREMPEYHVAYLRTMGPYNQQTCEQAFGELMQWAGPRGLLQPGATLMVYWDNPEVTPPEKCRIDACVSVPKGTAVDGAFGTQILHGGPYAVCNFMIPSDGFHKAWEDAFAWLVDSGLECDDQPCYELYHNDAKNHPDGLWTVEICIPLNSKA
jgi:AraC family transcriptional regulator